MRRGDPNTSEDRGSARCLPEREQLLRDARVEGEGVWPRGRGQRPTDDTDDADLLEAERRTGGAAYPLPSL